MIEFRLFEIDDIKELTMTAIDKSVRCTQECDLLKYARMNKQSGPAFTGIYNGRPICAAGINLRKNNSGHLWSIFTRSAQIHKKSVFKSLKLMFDLVIKNNALKKIVTESRKGFTESQTLIEHLGFEKQRRSFSDDYYFYRKVV